MLQQGYSSYLITLNIILALKISAWKAWALLVLVSEIFQ